MEYDSETMGIVAAKMGIDIKSVEYDIAMTELMNGLFYETMKNDVEVYLYGGTALNRGYFGEAQRLSIDLDLETPAQLFNANLINIKDILRELGYKIEVQRKIGEKHEAFYAVKSAKIRIEMSKMDLEKPRVQSLKLYPPVSFYGLPIPYSIAQSYEFEHLLAGKVNALSRRTLYKDVYDTYHAIRILKNEKLFVKYVKEFEKRDETDIVEEALYKIGQKLTLGTDADSFYRGLVPTALRESDTVMIETIKMRLKSIKDKFLN